MPILNWRSEKSRPQSAEAGVEADPAGSAMASANVESVVPPSPSPTVGTPQPSPAATAWAGLLEIRRQAPDILGKGFEGIGASEEGLLFLCPPEGSRKVVQVQGEDWGIPENWFFIGDLHGDFFAMHTLLHVIKSLSPDFRIVFLGDLVDRGPHPLECFFLLLRWAREYPGRIAWIAGNHDIALSHDAESGEFRSSVVPSEFVELLNRGDDMTEFRRAVGRHFIAVTSRLPRAIVFPDGMLATHGGFPHVDRQQETVNVTTRDAFLEWLNSALCLQDFTWTRITRYPRKTPNRYNTGCEYGFKDFEAFCALYAKWLPEQPVQRLITGHEHPRNGCCTFEAYKQNPAISLSGFGFDDIAEGRERFANYREELIVARYRKDSLPEIVRFPVNKEDLYSQFLLQAEVDSVISPMSEEDPATRP